ncbi:hypothetical protein K9L05_00345 [Candidatus Babeliales bacterium]|nr:hypothetical protein [Candidatus Babeliales bacterium]MCF7899084.1 hypothetical protein [Candidatus Babeliales bacterium]
MNNNKNNFKKILFIIFSVFINVSLLNGEEPQKPIFRPKDFTLKGLIEVNQDWSKTPEFRIFFDGQSTKNNEHGSFSFPGQKKRISEYCVIICKDFKQNFDSVNTIENLSVESKKPCLYYSFKKTGTNEKGEEVWEKKHRTDLETKKVVVPENCLIVQINPKYIADVEIWKINLPRNFIKLPKIILKNDIDETVFKKQSCKSLLYSLDKQVFHEKINEVKKIDPAGLKEILFQH